jgi:glycosyltransferase involved in cell wall biosynthesis
MTPGWPGVRTANGITTSVFNLARGLSGAGHTPVILTDNVDGDMPEDAGFPAPPVVAIERVWGLGDRVFGRVNPDRALLRVITRAIIRAAERAIGEHGIDVLVMEESYGWVGRVSAGLPIPVVAALHGPWALLSATSATPPTARDRLRIDCEARAFTQVAGLLAPSASALEIARAVPGADRVPYAVIPNSLGENPSPPDVFRDPGAILFVGRFDAVKGGDVVFDAFRLLHETHPQATLTFVGPDRGIPQADGSEFRIADALAALPDAARVRIAFRGAISRPEVEALRHTHAVALIASRYENLNYSLLEAMAAGQAVVCTNVGGPAAVMTDNETALMVPPGDPGALAGALARMLDDDALRTRLAENGRALLKRDFSPQGVATDTVTFLRDVLRRNSSGV